MAKPERGLPKSFDINVPQGPVKLGDYLEEPAPVAAAPAPEPAPQPPPPVFTAPVFTAPVPQQQQPQPPAVLRSSPPRKQFNMTPETLGMIDDLLRHIRQHSRERDVRASELVHALVLAVHEAMPYLDLTRVPMRGKWGSATAAQLPVALKDAFQQAMARRP